MIGTSEKDYSIAARNQAGPAKGKDCGIAMSFPFELLDIFVGAWAAACMEGMLEDRLLPDVDDELHLVGFDAELSRRRSFQAPEGCRYLKAVLCLDEFQLKDSSPQIFSPDIGKFLTQVERELTFRGLGLDRIATFKARMHSCSLLLLKIRDGDEDPALWSARKLSAPPRRDWSPEQQQVLDCIHKGTRSAMLARPPPPTVYYKYAVDLARERPRSSSPRPSRLSRTTAACSLPGRLVSWSPCTGLASCTEQPMPNLTLQVSYMR